MNKGRYLRRPQKAPDRNSLIPEARSTDAFYREFFLPLVRRAVWRHGLSADDARDIVQDAFLIALKKMNSARRPEAWLVQVVSFLPLNLHRTTPPRSNPPPISQTR